MIETIRLILRPWQPADLPRSIEMNRDVDVMRYFPSIMTPEESTASYERALAHEGKYGFCFWAAELKGEGEFIGFIGLQNTWFDAHFTPCIEIGWRLMKEHWGKGLAPEGAIACLDWAGKNGIDEVYSFTATSNTPSERVMQKIGMKRIGTFGHPLLDNESPLKKHVLYKWNR